MSGMGRGGESNHGAIVSSFHEALASQGRVVLALLLPLALALAVAWIVANTLGYRDGKGTPEGQPAGARSRRRWPEPRGRQLLRVAFGLLWLLDGVLQLQANMPTGLPGSVVQPAATGSPGWLRDMVRLGLEVWERHPVTAAVAAVWLQVGLGLWLLFVARGRWSRLGGLVSVGWALTVWVFGESMGGMLAPGSSWLFGAPGAVLLYALAGGLLALPEHAWRDRRLGRRLLAGLGVWLIAMAVLQAWPGRGFWQGHGNTLSGMVEEMAETPQPHLLSALLRDFASFVASNPIAVNAFVVCALAAIGATLLSGRPRPIRIALYGAAALCLADWVLVQDLGVLGGTGTDPNSAIPTLILLLAGYLALVRAPLARDAAAPVPAAAAVPDFARARRLVLLVTAGAITALGAVPLALAATQPTATTLLASSIDGPATPVPGNLRPPDVHLIDQDSRPMSFASLRGRVVLMTYLDPVCNSDCPIIAQEFKQADRLLGAEARRVELVAIDANPLYRSTTILRTFDHQERLEGLSNWLYLTGSLSQLRRIWNAFEVGVSVPGGGAMVVHALGAAVLDTTGRVRWLANFDPGPATAVTQSSFAATLAGLARQTLGA